jgi:hypothetical protein
MCWQVAIPLLASAGGAVMQNQAQNGLRRDQDRIAAEGIMRQAALNREADTRVAQTTQQIAASNPDAEIASKRANYTDALRKSLATRQSATPINGKVSGRYTGDASDAAGTVESDASKLADLTAQIEAPTDQRTREGVTMNNANVDLSLIKNRSASQDYLTRLRMAMQRPNGALMAGGQLLSGAGGAIAAGGGLGSTTDGVWNDGTVTSGLDAATRRNIWMRG